MARILLGEGGIPIQELEELGDFLSLRIRFGVGEWLDLIELPICFAERVGANYGHESAGSDYH